MDSHQLTHEIIGAAIEVHRLLGPGLLESAYEECLCHELTLRKLGVQRQVPVPVVYKEVKLECGYRLDLVVERKVMLELKSNRGLFAGTRSHHADVLAPLRL